MDSGHRPAWHRWAVGVVLLGLALLAIPPRTADATSGEYVDVTCPVCGNAFEGWEWHSTNTFGGRDRDGCVHAAGDAVFLLVLWTCPRCAFTGTAEAWDPKGQPTALVGRLRRENPLKPAEAIDPKLRRTTEIPAWVRWDLLRQVQDLSGDVPARKRASTCLYTAWTQRFGITFPPTLREQAKEVGAEYWDRAGKAGDPTDRYRRLLDAAAAMVRDAGDASSPLTPRERRVRLLVAAVDWKSRGEDPAAARALARLRAEDADLSPPIRELVADLEARIERERAYLARAVPLLEEALTQGALGEESPLGVRYLLGEIQRKLGDAAKARGWLEGLTKEADLPEGLRAWVDDALRKVAEAEAAAAGAGANGAGR